MNTSKPEPSSCATDDFESLDDFDKFERRLLPAARVGVTIAGMLVLVCAVSLLNVPNPNMILVSGLVVFSFLFGYRGGVPAGIIMLAYTMHFFSTGHSWTSYTAQNAQKLVVSFVGVTVVATFVCILKHKEDRAFARIHELALLLHEDNKALEEASHIDALTKTRNRLALEQDYPSYAGNDLHVMMVDVDDFKGINDKYGHEFGDHVLLRLGSTLRSLFGQAHSYRYGGDEFLVIVPNLNPEDFQAKCRLLADYMSSCYVDDLELAVRTSCGYVRGRAASADDLAAMQRQADALLYESKKAGKNRITGSDFTRS